MRFAETKAAYVATGGATVLLPWRETLLGRWSNTPARFNLWGNSTNAI